MIVWNFVFVVGYSALVFSGRDYCFHTSTGPYMTVANSTHIRINWENSFNEKCDDGEVKNAKLRIRRVNADYYYDPTPETIPVSFNEKKVDIEADPCLQHDMIRIELKHGQPHRNVISYWTGYNSESSKSCTAFESEYLYGGLLKEKVFNKTCKKNDGGYLIPDTPKEVKHCVQKITITEKSKQLSYNVVSPCYKNSHALVESLLSDVKSPGPSLLTEDEGEAISFATIGLIIGVSVLVLLAIIVIAYKVLFKKCQKRKDKNQTDENPTYEGAADYEYDEVEILNSSNKVSVQKREVKAEVVDRNSVYGESEEGWEDAIVNDTNDNYES